MKIKKIILGFIMGGALIASLASCDLDFATTSKTSKTTKDDTNGTTKGDDSSKKDDSFYHFDIKVKYLDQEFEYKTASSEDTFSLDTIRPTVEGYQFEGWFRDLDYTTPSKTIVPYSPSQIVVFAKFKSVHYDEIERCINSSMFDKTKDFKSELRDAVTLIEYDADSQTAQGKFLEQYAPIKEGYDLFELYWEKDVLCLKYQNDKRGAVEYVSLPIDKIQKDYNEEYVQTHNFLKNEKFEYNRYNGVDDFNIYRRTDTTLYTFIKENDYNIIYNCVIETNEIFTLVTFDNPNIEKIKCYIEGYSYHPIEQK